MRFGLIGCGLHGERYLRHLSRGDVPGAKAVAVFRRDAREAARLAREYGIRSVPSAAALLDDDEVDAVLVLTPPSSHRDLVRRCVEAKRPVLVEKPLTGTFDEAAALIEEVGADAAVMVGQTLRFSPALERARQTIEELGPVHRILATQRLEPSPLAWQRDATVAGGGSLVLTGVHLFDLLRWYTGRTPDAVQCRRLALSGHPLENLFDACFEREDPPLLMGTEVSKFSATRRQRVEIVGERAAVEVDGIEGRVIWRERREVRVLAEPGDVPTIPLALQAFVAWRRGEIECPVTLNDGLETMRMVAACQRSHDEGRRVRLDEINPGAVGPPSTP